MSIVAAVRALWSFEELVCCGKKLLLITAYTTTITTAVVKVLLPY